VDSHGELINCLRAGDGAGARAIMRAHIGITERAVAAALTEQGVVAADRLPG
jgi:DNA-binding GntR family transcriptional regulator